MNQTKISDGWLTANDIGNNIWQIDENGQDNMFLVIGTKKAMIIDTGWGISNLKRFIERIVDLPVIAVNTHGHSDHAMGNDAFETVYAGKEDIELFSNENLEERRSFIKNSVKLTEVKEKPKFGTFGVHAKVQDIPLADGMTFDLGDRVITTYLVPGHSKGSACFLDSKARVLFTGDSFVPSETWGPAWFHLEGSELLSVYYKKMKGVLNLGGFENMLSGHGKSEYIPIHYLVVFLDGIKSIIERKTRGCEEQTFVGPGLRCDWEGSSIIYDDEKIT